MSTRSTTTAILAALIILASGCAAATSRATGPTTQVPPGQVVQARTAIGHLRVGAPGTVEGYSRAMFGRPWADVDHNGCDTRNDILNRDLTRVTWKPNSHRCVVISGTLTDPYSGTVITFTKQQAAQVQIDHIVPARVAAGYGATSWTQTKREQFANDPLNLLAVGGSRNMAKGDKTPGAWMPPNRGSWCRYSVGYVLIASRYGIGITRRDRAALARGLATCPGA